ncbi:hypothetical protein E6Q11_04465 [Candidatus Dojkabacteria bacterium]|uniref:Uncharacterized protein n=1 Tax=Candidatus Dojkabacteria bacterium TaxID=2099670 RepID=A0A5C7J4R7_9BACT|nr:MAG: hypothetical protein E6Q11_04465 [Candidatus Dojkabacteria bacterium]
MSETLNKIDPTKVIPTANLEIREFREVIRGEVVVWEIDRYGEPISSYVAGEAIPTYGTLIDDGQTT